MNLPLSAMPCRRTSPMRNDLELETALDLDNFLPYRLSVLTNRVSSAIARQYSQRFNLSVPEWRVMAVLGSDAGLSAREVAARTAMDKVQVSRAVASLMRARRVQRQVDAQDARITRLSLTERGRAIYDEIVPLALHLESVLLSALSPEERKQLAGLLDKLARRVSGLSSVSL
jgi:DNA-binding MarR family transcriptional regulator